MCAICGVLNLNEYGAIEPEILRTMIAVVRHRGPDEAGVYIDDRVGLGHARLSIIDLSGGSQPLSNEDGTLWIVFNGEIYNYVELRRELEQRGHRFKTQSDTETIIHAYEEYGYGCLQRFNGQFAFALWDRRSAELLLARDRLGVRPLFYTISNGQLIFGSEIKSIGVHPNVSLDIDPVALREVFTYWAPLSPRTAFKEIAEVPPGHFMVVRNGQTRLERYWQLDFPEEGAEATTSIDELAAELREALIAATRLRLRADVPVGAYLSGGLDSSVITTIIRNHTDAPLITFSVRFEDERYDEGCYQKELIKYLDTECREVTCSASDIARVFPDVIWHTEAPILRTAPAPMFLLSDLVHRSGIKVVLTGEGSDEFLGGYNIYKEAKIRRFWARYPESKVRPLLLHKLYPYLAQSPARAGQFWQEFFRPGIEDTESPYYSHVPRWRNTAKLHALFSDRVRSEIGGHDSTPDLEALLNPRIVDWDPLARAQHVEISTFLSPYLLSSQGDRVGMAHSVEGRFPFLDVNVLEVCSRIPPRYKLRGLTEKYILKRSMQGEIPESIRRRAKQPYRAPDSPCFFGPNVPEYVRDLLSENGLKQSGFFDHDAVARLIRKCERRLGQPMSAMDDMAVVGVVSSQLLYNSFIERFSEKVLEAKRAPLNMTVWVDARNAPVCAS